MKIKQKLSLSFVAPLVAVLIAIGMVRSSCADTASFIPILGNFDGDTVTDPAAYIPETGEWLVMYSTKHYEQLHSYGQPRCLPIVGDYDGDHKIDIVEYDPISGLWMVALSGKNYAGEYGYGPSGSVPVPGDYDGDGKNDPVLVNTTSGLWAYSLSSYPGMVGLFQFPLTAGINIIPISADYDGDRKTDPAVYIPTTGEWRVLLSSNGYSMVSLFFGTYGDVPVVADYDGDRRADPALYNPITGDLTSIYSSYGYTPMYRTNIQSGGILMTVNWYGDGDRYDLVLVKGGLWEVLYTSHSDPITRTSVSFLFSLPPTGIIPEIGSYTFSVSRSRFYVTGEAGMSGSVTFQPQSGEGYSMSVDNGEFHYQNGLILGDGHSSDNWKMYPSDGFRLRGHFITPFCAIGTVDYIFSGEIWETDDFVANLQ